jgi:SAM-dependent methyltransferase
MRLHEAYPLPQTGRALDVGCGNGPTLRALARLAPGWDLYGHDISDCEADALASIPGFRELFVGDVDIIEGTFDLIAFCHSVEHIPSPVQSLAALRSKLAPGGRLVVEVPNVRQNIYDLVVADHRSHFDALTLADAAKRAGFTHFAVYDDWVFKELTLVAANEAIGATPASPASTRLGYREIGQRVAWLAATLERARQTAARGKTFGLFGTAIAATWAFGPLAQHVAFFVDEDAARIGQEFEGRPILAPDQIPEGATVFVPLIPNVAAAVGERLRNLGVDVQVPPAQEFESNNWAQ